VVIQQLYYHGILFKELSESASQARSLVGNQKQARKLQLSHRSSARNTCEHSYSPMVNVVLYSVFVSKKGNMPVSKCSTIFLDSMRVCTMVRFD
jgi:hypothetical protein